MTVFHLIRHAEYALTDRVLGGRTAGHGLNESGVRQADALATAMNEFTLTAIVSSPVQRAQETASAIARHHGLAVTTDPAFDEIDFGAWTGLSFAALDSDPAWQDWNRNRALASPPGGETMLAAQARSWAGLQRWRTGKSEGTIAIVSHADIIKAIVAVVLGTSLDALHRFEIAPASRTILRLGPADACVVALGHVAAQDRIAIRPSER